MLDVSDMSDKFLNIDLILRQGFYLKGEFLPCGILGKVIKQVNMTYYCNIKRLKYINYPLLYH